MESPWIIFFKNLKDELTTYFHSILISEELDQELGISKDYRGFQCGVKRRAIDDKGLYLRHHMRGCSCKVMLPLLWKLGRIETIHITFTCFYFCFDFVTGLLIIHVKRILWEQKTLIKDNHMVLCWHLQQLTSYKRLS